MGMHVWAAQIPALAVAKQRAAAWPVHKAMLIEMAPSVTAGAADEKLGILTADIVERVERVLDAVAIPPPRHRGVVLGLGRIHSSLAATNLAGVALVELAEHGVVRVVPRRRQPAVLASADAVVVRIPALQLHLLLNLPARKEPRHLDRRRHPVI